MGNLRPPSDVFIVCLRKLVSALRSPSVVCLGLALWLSGCAPEPPPSAPPTDPIPSFQPKPRVSAAPRGPVVIGPNRRERVAAGSRPPVTAVPSAAHVTPSPPPLPPVAEALSLEQVPLPAFVNEVFSKALHLTVQIDQRVTSRTDIVTLRTGRPLPADELFGMAKNILAGYGIGVSWDGSVLHIAPEDALLAQMPELIRSRAVPEMPIALRPIFQVVDLHQVSAADMAAWLTNAYGAKVKIFPAGKAAEVMLFGLPENVRAAVDATTTLDQARLAGRQSLRVTPVYWTARDLAGKLVDVLRAEGYDVASSAAPTAGTQSTVMLVPVEANNSLIAFAADAKVLAHIRQWIADLDQPGQADPLRSIFIYMVQNTTASSLGRIVQGVLGGQAVVGPASEVPLERAGRSRASAIASTTGIGAAASTAANPPTGAAAEPPPAAATAASNQIGAAVPQTAESPGNGASGPRLVIDQARNALVIVGTAQDYQRIRPLLEALDRAPREALIEVTIAELTLDDTHNLGINWTSVNHLGKDYTQRLGTGTNVLTSGGGLELGTSGFNYAILNGVGDVRALLNAFAENKRLSVLSTPRVLAKSGSEARIEVGTEVPIITSQGSTNTIQNAGTTGILQSIDYRKTGVLMTVTPVIHSGNRIDLTVSQEVSQALSNTTPGITSPLIQNRRVSTELTLGDGQTVVIGGLISESRTATDNGVPYLKDVPGLGLLFRNQALTKDRTELLVFITPYVISSDADAAAITAQFRDQMRGWTLPATRPRW